MTVTHAGEIPDWVPDSVKSMANAIEIGKEIANRLLSDPRMKPVWKWLQMQAQKMHNDGNLASRLADLPSLQHMETWGVSEFGVSLPDQACAAFFCSMVIELGVPKEAAKRQDILKLAEPWHSAAKLCQIAIHTPGRPGIEPELTRALSVVGEYFDEHAQFIVESANRNNPYLLKRSSGRRGDDTIRGKVRAMAIGTHSIFGNFLYGILATVAEVALQADVDEESIRNWCAGLPY